MWYYRALHAQMHWALRRALRGGPAKILDAGCGTGGLIRALRPRTREWRWSGIDFMPLACELARQRCGSDVDIREASVTALPFATGSFDAVVSADVLCQIDNPETAAAEFFRVLRPGGVAVINVPAYMWMWSYHDDAVHTKQRFARRQVTAMLRESGFGSIWTTHRMALLLPLVVLRRKLLRPSAEGNGSDVQAYPRPLNAALGAAMALERAWMQAGGRWAWGSSIFSVARKPGSRATPAAG